MEDSCIEYTLGDIALDRKWEAAIVLQGPYVKGSTEIAVRAFLQRNAPTVLVIVSTYLPAEEHAGDNYPGAFLSNYEKSSVENSKRLIYLFIRAPDREQYPDFWNTNEWNLQRLTTFAGLRLAKQLDIEVSLKCRTDTFLGMSNVTRYLCEKYLLQVPPTPMPKASRVQGRIVISDHTKSDSSKIRDYFIEDSWMFGYTDDLLRYFDITSDSSWDEGRGISLSSSAESHLAELWMKDMNIPSSTGLEELVGRYMAVAESVITEFVWMKRLHDYKRYLNEGLRYLSEIFRRDIRFYLTHDMWIKLLEQYAGESH